MILMLNFIYNSFQKLMWFHLCFSHFVSISRLQICIVSNNPFIIWLAVCQECFFFCSSWKKLKVDVKNHLLNIRSHMTQLLMRHMHKGYIHANISHSTILRGNGNVCCIFVGVPASRRRTSRVFVPTTMLPIIFAIISLHWCEKHKIERRHHHFGALFCYRLSYTCFKME